jgi:hypothetical protein
MRIVSEREGLERLGRIRANFAERIRKGWEHKAKDCAECDTPGACCLDAHFVNVRISRLEAEAISRAILALPPDLRARVVARIFAAIERYGLTDGAGGFYACPLYEKGRGCLVHRTARPLPCIAHACYEDRRDLPPDELLDEAEQRVASLNEKVYRTPPRLVPLPVAVLERLS